MSRNTPPPANQNILPPSAEDMFGQLLSAVGRRQDKGAFAELFEYFAPRIKSYLIKGGATPDQAEEIAQDTMVTIWQKADSFDPARARAATWIFTIARNKRIDALRKRVRPEIDADDLAMADESAPSAFEMAERRNESEIMADMMEQLPEEQASLLYKSFFEDKTHADIAKETNIPLGTVKSRIRLALEKLRGETKVRSLWS